MPTIARHTEEVFHGSRHPHWENLWKRVADSSIKLSKVDYVDLGRSAAQYGLIAYMIALIGVSAVGLERSQNKVRDKLWSLPSLPPEHEREWWKHIRVPE